MHFVQDNINWHSQGNKQVHEPVQLQAITWTNIEFLLVLYSRTHFSEILIQNLNAYIVFFEKMHWKVLSENISVIWFRVKLSKISSWCITQIHAWIGYSNLWKNSIDDIFYYISSLTYWHRIGLRSWSTLVQVMACHWTGAQPLPELMLTYCQFDL